VKYALVLLAAFGLAVAGCRSNGDRNGDRNGSGTRVEIEKVKDPVCGMTCDRNETFKYTYQGRDYYFCHQECMKKFQENPGRYEGGTNDRYPTPRTP
jgi:Cu+-exporting ATPase